MAASIDAMLEKKRAAHVAMNSDAFVMVIKLLTPRRDLDETG